MMEPLFVKMNSVDIAYSSAFDKNIQLFKIISWSMMIKISFVYNGTTGSSITAEWYVYVRAIYKMPSGPPMRASSKRVMSGLDHLIRLCGCVSTLLKL